MHDARAHNQFMFSIFECQVCGESFTQESAQQSHYHNKGAPQINEWESRKVNQLVIGLDTCANPAEPQRSSNIDVMNVGWTLV